MPQWFKQNILQGLDIIHEQLLADIPDGRLSVLENKEKRILEKETKPIKVTSISDRIAQKKAVISQKESKKQSQEKHKSNERDL